MACLTENSPVRNRQYFMQTLTEACDISLGNRVIENLGRVAEYWTVGDVVSSEGEKAVKVVLYPLQREKYLDLNREWLENYITKRLLKYYNRYCAEVCKDGSALILWKGTIELFLKECLLYQSDLSLEYGI